MTSNLLQKYIQGEASEAERKQVTLWLMESPEHVKQYRTERKLFESLLWNEELNHVDGVADTLSKEKRSRNRGNVISFRSVFRELAKVAAVVAITLSAVTWFTDDSSEQLMAYQEFVVPSGQRAELNLSDGTKVWLNSRSTLTFPTSFSADSRNVKLEGEGYFKVSKNKGCPFIVETNKGNIRVLGTEFNVTAYRTDSVWETALLNGSVEIISPETQETIMKLEPNTKVTLKGNQYVKDEIGETSRFLWREGLLCFTNNSVREMFKKI